jgi:hypothetical protein
MGYVVEPPYYGIWNRGEPNSPAMRFPYSEHGKAEAVARFYQLEPRGQDLSVPSTPPPPVDTGGEA